MSIKTHTLISSLLAHIQIPVLADDIDDFYKVKNENANISSVAIAIITNNK